MAVTVRTVAVIDIDGVVADVRHRLPYLGPARKRWDRFFAAAADDPLLEVGAALAHDLAARHEIIWSSGRPEWLRATTQGWLEENALPPGHLRLRPGRDHRPAAVVKVEVLRSLARTATVAAVVDDDPDVIAAVTAAGFPAVLADWVPHEKTLREAQERDGRT